MKRDEPISQTSPSPWTNAWKCAAAVVLLAAAGQAQTLTYRAELTGTQVVPPASSTGMGTAWFLLDLDANTLTYDMTFDQLAGTETAAHIDGFAAPGATGATLFSLGIGKHKSGSVSYDPADETDLIDGLAYVTVDSTSFPSGELRGQITRVHGSHVLVATLSGADEVPPVTTAAMGTAIFVLDPGLDTLTYELTFADLSSSETESHLNGYAAPGQVAPILFDLGLGFHKTGSWIYPTADEPSLLAGLLYANVHSANNTDGEIRGQIEVQTSNPVPYCSAKISSLGCIPTINWQGSPTSSGPDDFKVGASDVLNNSMSVLYWSRISTITPFMNGTLCIDSASKTIAVARPSGGNPPPSDCSGVPVFDFTQAIMTANGLAAGDLLFAQWWYRDPANIDGTGFGLTDALAFEILP